jgi:hypothetical protein
MSDEDWAKLDKKAIGTIRLCLVDVVFLNVSVEATTYKLWKRIGDIYQTKSVTNKLYYLKMKDGDYIPNHLNDFNLILSQLEYVDVQLEDEDKLILLIFSLPKSWENLIVAMNGSGIDPKI